MTTYERATHDYDEAHEQRLVDEIHRVRQTWTIPAR